MGKLFFSAKAVIVIDNKFLALKRTEEKKDLWELPGGRMEFGEKLEETLIREVKEETNLDIIPDKIINSWDLIQENIQISGVIYLCKYISGNIILSNEHREYKWLNFQDSDKLYPEFASRLKMTSFE